jgi:hypothetical protein
MTTRLNALYHIERLRACLLEAKDFKGKALSFGPWHQSVRIHLGGLLGEDSPELAAFLRLAFYPTRPALTRGTQALDHPDSHSNAFRGAIATTTRVLEEAIARGGRQLEASTRARARRSATRRSAHSATVVIDSETWLRHLDQMRFGSAQVMKTNHTRALVWATWALVIVTLLGAVLVALA